jgi:predicted nucleic acid-binding protein
VGGNGPGISSESRPSLYLFDSSVLSTFALVGQLTLLERRYAGRTRWTIEVRHELLIGAGEISALAEAAHAEWLGEPLRMDDVLELVRIEDLRARLGGKPEDHRHRGEAATIVAAEQSGGVAVMDDFDATRLARARGVPTLNTIAILKACVRSSMVTVNEAKDLLDEMIDSHDRQLPRVGEDELRDP